MKNLLFLLLLQLFALNGFTQNSCLDFENETPNLNPGWTDPAGNWFNILSNFDYKQEASGNIYLQSRDRGGASWIVNTTDFTGNLAQDNECKAFCYDINYQNPGGNNPFFSNTLHLFSGGTNSTNATLSASFNLYTPLNSNDGWITVCLPLNLCSSSNLPSNAAGQWRWNTSSSYANTGSDCNDWNTLVQSVSGIAFFIDRGGSTTEIWGYDNFCITDTTCFGNKLFSTCFHTDFQDPTRNDFDEYAYAGIQKQNGEYYVFGETENRGIFQPGVSSDDYLLHAGLDALGNVIAPAQYLQLFEPSNNKYTNHVLVEMNPPFNGFTSPYLVFSNYQELGTFNNDIQLSLINQEDCMEFGMDWTDSANESEFVFDAFQASNDHVIIVGETATAPGPVIRNPFIYGFDITGSNFGNQKINFISPTGTQGTPQSKAVCEYDDMGIRRYAMTGTIENQLLLFTSDESLNLTNNYNWYNLDGDSNTREIGEDIVFDAANRNFYISGVSFLTSIGGTPGAGQIFLCNLSINGQVNWVKFYDIAGGVENVEEIHLNGNGEIAISGSCEIQVISSNGPRVDRSFLLKTDSNGSLLWANKYTNAEGTEIQDLEFCVDDGYLLSGSCWTNTFSGGQPGFYSQNHDIWTVKTDADGNLSDTSNCLTALVVNTIERDFIVGINECYGESLGFDGADYERECLDFQHSLEVCDQYCPPPPGGKSKCDSLDISFDYVETFGDTCCWNLDINNLVDSCFAGFRLNGLNGLRIWQASGSATYGIQTFNGSSYTIVPSGPGFPGLNYVAVGNQPAITKFCISGYTGTPQLIEVEPLLWNGNIPINYEVDCVDTLQADCAISIIEEPCVSVVNDTVFCVGDTIRYCFQVKNHLNNSFPVDSIVLVDNGSGVFSPNRIPLSPPIQPGDTSALIYVDIQNATPGDSLYYILVGKNEPECCTDSTVYCVPIPICDTCALVSVSTSPYECDSLCFNINLHNNFDPNFFTGVQTEVLTSGAYLYQVNNFPGSGWWHTDLFPFTNSNLDWKKIPPTSNGIFINTGTTTLPKVCLSGYSTIPQQIEVRWMKDSSVVCRDTLTFDCIPPPPVDTCITVVYDTVRCLPNGNYAYDFQIQNLTNHTIHTFDLNNFSPSVIFVNPISGVFHETIPALGFSSIQTLEIDGGALFAGDQICYQVTGHESTINSQGDTIHLRCCTSTNQFCFVLPDCCNFDCPNNLVQNPGINSNTVSTGNLGGPGATDFWMKGALSAQITPDGHCDSFSIQSWGDMTVKESYCQSGISIQQGKTYSVSFCAKFVPLNPNTAVTSVNVRFSGDNSCPGNNDYDPVTAEIMGVQTNITSTNWANYTLPDWTASADYNTLIVNAENFLPTNSNATTISWARVDNICITEVVMQDTCCQSEDVFDDILYNNTMITQSGSTVNVDNLLLTDCHRLTVYWGDGNSTGPVLANQLPLTHTYTANEEFQLCVFLEELDGNDEVCYAKEDCKIISFIDAVFTPQVNDLDISIFPNPVTGETINVSLSDSEYLERIEIYDILGKRIFVQQIKDRTSVFQINTDLPEGTYFVKVSASNAKLGIEKIVKFAH